MYGSAKFWDKVADRYAAMPIRNKDAYQATLNSIRVLASSGSKLLELGCGTGSTAVALATDFDRVIATDISEAMLKIGRDKAKEHQIENIDFVLANAVDAPEGPFDVVLALNLLHLLENMDDDLVEIAKRTKPGGVFVSKTFCMPARRNLIWFFIQVGLPVMQAFGKAPYFAKLLEDDLIASITQAGFAIVDVKKSPVKDPRVTITARRPA